jgi:hypothetical protein
MFRMAAHPPNEGRGDAFFTCFFGFSSPGECLAVRCYPNSGAPIRVLCSYAAAKAPADTVEVKATSAGQRAALRSLQAIDVLFDDGLIGQLQARTRC